MPRLLTLLTLGLFFFATATSAVAADGSLSAEEREALDESAPQVIAWLAKGEPLVIPEVAADEVICFCLYTTHDGVLKLSAQLYPLGEGVSRDVTLHLDRGDGFQPATKQAVDADHWMTTFRVEDWDDTREGRYRVTHPDGASYEGVIRKNPVDKNEIVVAAFTGNSNSDRGPRPQIIANVKSQDPDLLFFSGDQSYDHKRHLAAWLLFGRQFGEVIRDRPTITIPDDHDVGQGNLWGAGGKRSYVGGGADGGYIMSPEYVNMVQRAQIAHLPDPYDAAPIGLGISVYYTNLNIGGVDFAIIEDRKWKTGPMGLVPKQGPRPDHITDPNYDPTSVDQPEAVLLGERQLEFLDAWGQDWTGADIKCVLSQTIFAGGAHLHGKTENRVFADMDSNGWPQAGRDRALRAMRKCFAFHIAGDQHLATVIHHGLNEWEDSCWSFCVPSIVNYYGRWWWPLEEHQPGTPDRFLPKNTGLKHTGRFYDGFHNKLTVAAYANPTRATENAAGYGLVRFDKQQRTITMECWPKPIDATAPDAKQYQGWPITVDQKSNYARPPRAFLPRIKLAGDDHPVLQVIRQGYGDLPDEVVYTIRTHGKVVDVPVFHEKSRYTVRLIGDESTQKIKDVPTRKKPGAVVLSSGKLEQDWAAQKN